nr:uncharacterized protein LOC129388311 [Dermacentor andersoni]
MYLLKAYIIIGAASLCVKVNAEVQTAKEGEVTICAGLRIVEVFNTTEKLWLYQQNYSNEDDLSDYGIINTTLKQECTFFKQYNITQDDYYFWRNSNIANQWVSSRYHGRFFSDGGSELGSMNVSDLSENDATSFEIMKLMYEEKNCSVFSVTFLDDDGETGCELYVQNKAISHGPSENCTEYYEKHCNTTFLVYHSGCQNATIMS